VILIYGHCKADKSIPCPGSDTTSAVLCAVFFYLATYRTAYDRLRSEIRGAFHSLHEIRSGPVLQSCTYLDACLKEAMRISPGVSSALYRKVTKGGAVIAGHRVPAGCSVATGVYSLHHDPRYFLRPGVFVPERWRPGDKGEGAGEGESGGVTVAGGSGGASAYVPFSLGSRACLGRALALTELRILTAAIVWRFDFRFPPSDDASIGGGHPLGREGRTSPVEFQLRDYIVSHKKGPVLQLRPRRLS
jgi:cytochrome P450